MYIHEHVGGVRACHSNLGVGCWGRCESLQPDGPCKTFAGAISKTAAGGEISVLDPGGYGAVTITKSITINGIGANAGILASLTNGIVISALNTDTVRLKNLQINGNGNGLVGIKLNTGAALVVEDVFVFGFDTGIETNAGTTTVNNSLISWS